MSKKNSLEQQLDKLWNNHGEVITLDSVNQKYVVISDMHMGDGSKSDDFRKNESTAKRLLDYYNKNNFKLILLGDIEELWQFSLDEIINKYNKSVYNSIRKFGDKRVYRIFGNHDLDWKLSDPIRNKTNNYSIAIEAIKLNDNKGIPKILLVHGHQGTLESDKMSWISKPFVKAYGRGIESLIKIDKATAAPRSPILKSYERKRFNWAKKKHLILICGHSHRAFFASKSKLEKLLQEIKDIERKIRTNASTSSLGSFIKALKEKKDQVIDEKSLRGGYVSLGNNPNPHYFNSGCALYSDGITVLEIVDDTIKLVKWHRQFRPNKPFDTYEQASLSQCISNL